MPRGEPQLEPAEAPAALPPESAPVSLEPAVAAPVAVPYGARDPESLNDMRDTVALSGQLERRRFVLQLQRTAGNAAVCRWLNAVRGRTATGADGSDEPPDEAPRER